jgi:glutamate 5-kinase
MHIYDEAFEKYNIITAQVLLTKDDLRNRRRFLNARNTFSTLLSEGVIPIVNENDTVVVEELKFGDNDFLATLILNLVDADLFINLTSAKGVYTSNPDQDPKAKMIPFIKDIRELNLESMCEGKTLSGSGGMYSKLLAAKRAAQLGVPTLIVSGRIPFVLEKVFSGEQHGTWIFPQENVIPRRKFWFAYNLEPEGTVIVDLGAKNALLFQGKSLLPAGVVRVEGNFRANSLVKIVSEDCTQIGVGLCNFTSEELRQIIGKKTKEIAVILNKESCPEEVVHRDNLLIDAIL